MFIWLSLPEYSVNSLATHALKNGVAVVPSIVFYPSKDQISSALRLIFTHARNEELKIGENV